MEQPFTAGECGFCSCCSVLLDIAGVFSVLSASDLSFCHGTTEAFRAQLFKDLPYIHHFMDTMIAQRKGFCWLSLLLIASLYSCRMYHSYN